MFKKQVVNVFATTPLWVAGTRLTSQDGGGKHAGDNEEEEELKMKITSVKTKSTWRCKKGE